MKARVAVLAGDGIGPEVIAEGQRCLHAIAGLFGHEFELTLLPFGGAAIESHADPLPESTLSACLAADAVLLGAIGGPKWSAPQAPLRPERSEEHTSELQSRLHLVCRLLLEKKKTNLSRPPTIS